MPFLYRSLVALVVILAGTSATSVASAQGRIVTRLFWQDDESVTVRCADLRKSSEGWSLEVQPIGGLPFLDQTDQSLVQMRCHDGVLLVGVRDADDGNLGSGWMAIETGVTEEPHGDHSHWSYRGEPAVIRSKIDTTQGNPAHVYLSRDHFVIANDKRNGFTLTSAERLRHAASADDAAEFIEGGQGHITLAVDPRRVAYATWIDSAGEHAGQVDVVGLGKNRGRSYAFRCPTGSLHGAALVGDRAFFAPADGICWVDVDPQVTRGPDSVVVHHLSLGTDDNSPRRTGAFAATRSHLVFTTGRTKERRLHWIDATADAPEVRSLDLPDAAGVAITTPMLVESGSGGTTAWIFAESKEDPTIDQVHCVQLDPNRDGDFSDAAVLGSIPVGPSQIRGHSGHHSVAPLPDGRHILVANPGDGSFQIVHLNKRKVVATLDAGGTPTRLLSVR